MFRRALGEKEARFPLQDDASDDTVPLQDYGNGVPDLEKHALTRDRGDLLQGTLGLLILKSLTGSERHGYGIARWIEEVTDDVLAIPEGSLYPALRRLEARGLITSRWDISENNRQARFYALTSSGRKHLQEDASQWMRFSDAVARVLRTDPRAV